MRTCFSIALAAGFTVATMQAASVQHETRAVRSVVRTDARSGRLVRSLVVAPKPVRENVIAPRVVTASAPAARDSANLAANSFQEAVDQIAEKHDLPPQLVHSVIRVESNYNPYAVSSKGAQGLMQLIPSTARRFGVSDAFNPLQNIEGGVRYLKYLLTLFNGNYPLALAAYNAGEAAVARYGGVPPYPETQSYIYQVWKSLGQQRQNARKESAAQAAADQKKQVKPDGAPNAIEEVVDADGKVHYVSR